MKARIINKTVSAKVNDWLLSLPKEVADYVGPKVVVTGGSIASMFLREPVNDYDVYFKNIKAAMVVTQHYCKKWVENNEAQRKSGKVVKDIVPVLRLTFNEELGKDEYANILSMLNVKNISEHYKRVLVDANNKNLDEFLETHNYWKEVDRVEVFIQSQGFLGDNPDEEYKYFEQEETGSAEDFIDNSLVVNEDGLNSVGDKYRTVFMSSNAITLSDKMQLVIRFFGEPSKIHDTYDFIHATNYWTASEGLVTNTRALEALLSKELVYAGSKYPLASIFRTRKFILRDWTCHVGNYVKMAMQLNEMDLTDPEVLEEQLTGVDAAYLYEIIRAVKDKKKDDPDFVFNSTYICTLVDRLMGESGRTAEDCEEVI